MILPSPEDTDQDVSTSREIWVASGIVDYRYTFHAAGGLCASPHLSITVRSNRVRSVKYAQDARDCGSGHALRKGREVVEDDADAYSHTIDDLFERLESCADDCVIMSASFHPTYGFPVYFHMQSTFGDGTMIEDASYYGRTLAFEIL